MIDYEYLREIFCQMGDLSITISTKTSGEQEKMIEEMRVKCKAIYELICSVKAFLISTNQSLYNYKQGIE